MWHDCCFSRVSALATYYNKGKEMRLYPIHPMIKDLLEEYKQCTLSDIHHKSGADLVASLEYNKRVLRDGLRTAKRLGYSHK